MLDNDPKGKQTYRALTGRHTNYRENRDIFLLHRKFPRHTRDPNHLTKSIAQENAEWTRLDCEIEDLINIELLEYFLENNPNSIEKRSNINDTHHIKFKSYAKASLYRFIEENALYEDLFSIVEVLKSLRYYVGLDTEGENI